jgi:hypothetical protein
MGGESFGGNVEALVDQQESQDFGYFVSQPVMLVSLA